jgi:hypothetical protein
MARGWESKSVEAQIEESAATKKPAARAQELSPTQITMLRERENLELSRTRVKREIATSTNPRYQEILKKALADLESKLGHLEPVKASAAAAR